MTETNSRVDAIAGRVPNEIRRAVRGLSSDISFAIMVLLLREGGLSFSELQEDLEVHQQTLTNTLSQMQDGGIIVRNEVYSEDSQFNTRYDPTEYGKRILDAMYDAIQPSLSEVGTVNLFQNESQWSSGEYSVSVYSREKTRVAETSVDDATMVGGPTGAAGMTRKPKKTGDEGMV